MTSPRSQAAIVVRPTPHRIPGFVIALALLLSVLPGCIGLGNLRFRNPNDQLTTVRPRFSDDPQLEEVVDHLNRNVEKLSSWRAHSIQIRANNIPLHGTLAVEKGGHLRLQVNTVVGHEVDLGSNDDVFWIWAKRMEPSYVYCRHDQIDSARQSLGVPFEPDWLMQALGVSPIDPTGLTMQIDATNHRARLVQPVVTAHGHTMQKVMLVDLVNGVIVEHSVHDGRGQKLAQARLGDFRVDRKSGAVLARHVNLDWPQNQMSLVMNLGHVDVNPSSIPSQIWAMPEMPGVKMVDLGKESSFTRTAANRDEPLVRLLEPETMETTDPDDAGRVTLSGDETPDPSSTPFEEPESVEFQTTPIERPSAKVRWDED